ncbi:MAG: imidazole glycerol phosphate synthase subunit HisF [Desulfobacteraceae bacterium]
MITLLDYGAGNVRSVINSLSKLGETVKIAGSADDILAAEKLIFPGVGHYGSMIRILREKGYIEPLKKYLESDRPFLGICLGFQALFQGSQEWPDPEGLSIFKGTVERFKTDLSVPHIGWNGIHLKKPSSLFSGIRPDETFYFVHSYHVVPEDESVILTTTEYGYPFVSAVQKGNITGTQFHPEKSGQAGLAILKNFVHDEARKMHPQAGAPTSGLVKRIVACLDVRSNDDGDLVVTKGDQYDVREKGDVRNLGKPVELARDYYEQGADEITFLNITGFRDFPLEDLPMIEVLKKTSENVFVPLTIGGGIRDYTDASGRTYTALEVAAAYFRAGADKVSIGSDAVYSVQEFLEAGRKSGESAIEQISRVYGNQAVVVSVDPRKVWVKSPGDAPRHKVVRSSETGPAGEKFCWYQCTVKGGREGRDIDAVTFAKACGELGAGEILLNSIDRDGTNSGFDLELVNAVKEAVSIPVIASSGAGCEQHFLEVFTETRTEAALAAGIFHRKEVPVQKVKQYLKDHEVEVRYTGV